jgi:hypothetical protein
MATTQDPRPVNRLLMFAGHYAFLALAALVALVVADDAAGQRVPLLSLAADIALPVCIVVMFVGFSYHNVRLCERCVTATPLDPQKAVTRWDAVLRFDHMRGWKFLAYFALFAANVAANVAANWRGWGDVTDILFVVFIGALYGAEYGHRRLYPWCPYCPRWDGGGEHELSPDVPDPALSK